MIPSLRAGQYLGLILIAIARANGRSVFAAPVRAGSHGW
jgi:hypothetical protein